MLASVAVLPPGLANSCQLSPDQQALAALPFEGEREILPLARPATCDDPLTGAGRIVEQDDAAGSDPLEQPFRHAPGKGMNRPRRAVDDEKVDRMRQVVKIVP